MHGKITALTLQKRNRNRINVYLDGEFAFGLTRIVAAWLQIGQELSEEKIAELQAADAEETAYQRALLLLNSRPRTRAEIARNLQNQNIPENIQQAIFERLQRSGLLDDAAFARAWIANREEFRPRGQNALRYELRQHGVEEHIIQQVITENPADEYGQAVRAAEKTARKLSGSDAQTFRRKLGGFLARRGFNYETSARVIAHYWHTLSPNSEEFENEEI